MGWFGGEDKKNNEVIHTSERKQCWKARDSFFACLDQFDIIDAIKEDGKTRKSCPKEIKEFEQACIPTWSEYFKQKRVADITRQKRIQELEAQGYKPMDSGFVISEVQK